MVTGRVGQFCAAAGAVAAASAATATIILMVGMVSSLVDQPSRGAEEEIKPPAWRVGIGRFAAAPPPRREGRSADPSSLLLLRRHRNAGDLELHRGELVAAGE